MAARCGGICTRSCPVFQPGQTRVQGIDAGFQRGHLVGSGYMQALEHGLYLVISGLLDLVPGAGGLLAGLVQ